MKAVASIRPKPAVEEASAPTEPRTSARKAFMKGDLLSLDAFTDKYPLHEHCVVAAYHIYRDLFIKRELTDLTMVDAGASGCGWGNEEYFIQGLLRDPPHLTRMLIPYHLDNEIDLHWLQQFATSWLKQGENREVQVALHTAETIIYQSVHVFLPGLDD